MKGIFACGQILDVFIKQYGSNLNGSAKIRIVLWVNIGVRHIF